MQEVFLERRKGHLDENLNALFLASVITVQSALFVKPHFVLIVAIATVLLIIGRSAHPMYQKSKNIQTYFALPVHWAVERYFIFYKCRKTS